MNDTELFELIDFQPENLGWIQDMYRRELGGQFSEPKPHWCQWAKDFLCQPIEDSQGLDVLIRLLTLSEQLYPGGMERNRLEESAGYLFNTLPLKCSMRPYMECCISNALTQRVIREDRIDMWAPGMRSGQGWRTYYRLTPLAKSKVNLSGMPLLFSSPSPTATSNPADIPEKSVESAPKIQVKAQPCLRKPQTVTPPAENPVVKAEPAPTLPNNFIWSNAYVDQQVQKFFQSRAADYKQMAIDVLNGKTELRSFGITFGPAAICRWINEKHHVRAGHPNPCKSQNINTSATYKACVKTFKANAEKHRIAKQLYKADSQEVEDILNQLFDAKETAE